MKYLLRDSAAFYAMLVVEFGMRHCLNIAHCNCFTPFVLPNCPGSVGGRLPKLTTSDRNSKVQVVIFQHLNHLLHRLKVFINRLGQFVRLVV